MGYAGHMCIELIQPLDDHPSVYSEIAQSRGFGFHHVGISVPDVDAAMADYLARRCNASFRADVQAVAAFPIWMMARTCPALLN